MQVQDYLESALEESNAVKAEFVEKNGAALIEAAREMATCIRSNGKILVFGNGGSASDAQHMAGEMIGRLMVERRALPVIALTTDTSSLTAVGNDYGYEYVFQRQIQGLARKGDLVIAISTSGNSPNVLRATETAREIGCRVVGLMGKDGGALKSLCDYPLVASLGKTSPRIQETHIFAIHSLVDLLDRYFLNEEK